MRRVLAVERIILKDPKIKTLVHFDSDVCIRELGRSIEWIVEQALAIQPKVVNRTATDRCSVIADITPGSGYVNAGVFILRR